MDSIYTITLLIHSWNRWIVLLTGIAAIVVAVANMQPGSTFTTFHRKLYLVFISSLHLQLLAGLLLYFVFSPVTTMAFSNLANAMHDTVQRFFVVEHTLVNLIAIAVAQIGSIKIRKQKTAHQKHKVALIWFSIALMLIISMIPMGMMGVERPWFRF